MFILLFLPIALFAQTDLSAYTALEGLKSNAILTKLNTLISDHTVLTYDDVRGDRSGVDYNSTWDIIDIYSDCEFTSKSYCRGNEDLEDCACYNREHTLPVSWWGGSKEEPMYTDLHHIFPTDYLANTTRSAWAYAEVTGKVEWQNSLGSKLGNGSLFGETVFEPADEYKGDIARVYFYMVTCYLNKNFKSGGKGYRMFSYNNSRAGFTNAAQTMLLKWHRADPVSDKERKRNNGVEKKQGNRNPFVDDPELAEYIWGNKMGQAYTTVREPEETALRQPVINYDITIDNGNVSLTMEKDAQVSVYSSVGQCVYSNYTDYATLSLPCGLYILKVGATTRKLLID